MALLLRSIVVFIPFFFTFYFQYISNDVIFPLSFTDLSPKGNELSEINSPTVDTKTKQKDEALGGIYESSVYVSSMKPISDQSFKIIKLSNDVEAILNSAPNLDECHVSLLNKVGFLHDPSDLHGLTFYLMNILISASGSNPRSGLYDFVSDNSLQFLYEVHSTYSIYDIKLTPNLFENTLMLVSEMLKSPVFTEEVLEKAVFLIEKKISSDLNSYVEFLTTLVLSDPKNPLSKNKYGDINYLKKLLQERRDFVKQSLVKLFNEQYSSNKLTLSLKCNIPIKAIQELVSKYFSGIPNKNLTLIDQHKQIDNISANPLYNSAGKILYRIESEEPVLNLIFPLKNYLLPYMKSSPLFFIETSICEDKEGSLFRHLKKEKLVSAMHCYITNVVSGYSYVQFNFNLSNNGFFNIEKIIRAFFLAINKTKELKLDLNSYRKVKQKQLLGVKSSAKYFSKMNSLKILNNYFRHKSTAFKQLLLGLNEFLDFDINLHKQILTEIRVQNMIIVYDYSDGKTSIDNVDEYALFDESITTKDCSKYEEFLSKQESFKYISFTNVLSTNFNQVVKSNGNFKYILEEQNECLKKYFTNFPESLSKDLAIFYEKKSALSRFNTDAYSKTKRFIAPMRLEKLFKESSRRADNFSQFKDFYYFIPHSSPTNKISLAINFAFPFENKKLAAMSTSRVVAILLLFKEILISHSENAESHLASHSVEVIPEISLPKDSILNTFGISLMIASVPEAFERLITNLSVNLNGYINLEQNLFNDFKVYYIKVLTKMLDKLYSHSLYNDFINQINLNHRISTEVILNEVQNITLEETREVIGAIFKQGEISGVIYGNLTPTDAEVYLSKFYREFKGDAPKKKTSKFKSLRKSRITSKMRYSRFIAKIGSRRTRTRKIALTKKGTSLKTKKVGFTKKSKKTKQGVDYGVSSRTELYKLYSSGISRSSSESCKNLQILDMSSIKPGSKFFLQKNSASETRNVSVMWLYIDKATPESFVFTEYLKYIISNRLSADQRNNNGVETSVKEYTISPSSYFISVEGRSATEDSVVINNILSSYVDKFFSASSTIFNEELFNAAKEFLIRKYKKEGIVLDSSIVTIFEEIKNKRFDFVKFRSIASLLDSLTFEQFTLNLKKIHKSTFSVIFSVSISKSQSVAPNGFTLLQDVREIHKLSGIKTFKPSHSRVDKELYNLPEQTGYYS